MMLSSSAFLDGEMIPQKYGRDFENINPPLHIDNIPVGAVSLVLILEDPDIPASAPVCVWDHWVVFNISPSVRDIPENWSVQGVRGKGTRGELVYGGPRPPDKVHRYFFTLYALDNIINLPEGVTKEELQHAMQGHVLERAQLMGKYAPHQEMK